MNSKILVIAAAPPPLVRTRKFALTRLRPPLLMIAVALLLWASARTTWAATYVFTDVNSSAIPGSTYGVPSINASGDVAFELTSPNGAAILRVGSGGLATIAATGDTFRSFGTAPSINSAGSVAFRAFGTAGSGIFIGQGNGVTPIVLSEGSAFDAFGSSPSISSNEVAFYASLDGGGNGIFAGNGGAPATIASSSDVAFSGFGDPRTNATGTIAFVASRDTGGESLIRGNSAELTTLANTDGGIQSFGGLSMNGSGTIAFKADLDDGDSGVFLATAGLPSVVALRSDSSFEFFGNVAISDGGGVAFKASLVGGASGIFTGPDVAGDKIVATGDALFGSTVVEVSFGGAAVNDTQAAFSYRLTDGRSGIAIATVPEPASSSLVFASAVLFNLTRYRWRRRSGAKFYPGAEPRMPQEAPPQSTVEL